jgi:hypothetical protein
MRTLPLSDDDYFSQLVENSSPERPRIPAAIAQFVRRLNDDGTAEVLPITDETRLDQLKVLLRTAALSVGRRAFMTAQRNAEGGLNGLRVTIGERGGRKPRDPGVEIGA